MKKFLFILIITLFAVSLGWQSLSQDLREQALTLITIAKNRDREGAKAFLYDILASESPRDKRQEIIERLKDRVGELKEEEKRISSSGNSFVFDGGIDGHPILPVLIESADGIIKELEDANKKETIGEIITEKISDTLFPQNAKICECGQ